MNRIFFLFLILFLNLNAHQLKENYLRVSSDENGSSFSLEVETRLFESEKFIDDNHNGIISYKELRLHQEYLLSYVLQHFNLYYLDEKLVFKDSKVVFHRYQDQTYMQIDKYFKNLNFGDIVLKYDMFFELEKTHKLLIHLDENRGDYIIGIDNPVYHFSGYKMKESQRLYIFVRNGISHILDGIDHLLFVFMLLLPSMMLLRVSKADKPLQSAFISLLKVITLFSIAHSLSLVVSASGWWTPNIKFVESSIALTIFIVAFLNFTKKFGHFKNKIVFLFGLLHGFGFANVLEIAQVKDTLSFVVALFGFNLGVELGQIFVIVLLLPLLYFVAKSKYSEQFIKIVSLITMLISLYWFMQRVGLL